VSPFHIAEAAYIIQNSYTTFPEGTIHIIGIDAEHTPENRHVAVKLNKQYFICADNGVLCLIMNKLRPEKVVEINIHDRIASNFTMLDAFVETACHIARGGTLEVIGKAVSGMKALSGISPQVDADGRNIHGQIIYIDNYGNSVTNITRDLFNQTARGRKFTLSARSEKHKVIYDHYSDIVDFSRPPETRDVDGKGLCIFNSSGYIELATYKSNPLTVGSASSLFGLHLDTPVIINFENS
jgi:S-adenosylmethionine hydrolase